MVTADTFREHFAEFASQTAYSDDLIAYWLSIGTLLLPADRWADLLDHGLELFLAHNLVLERQALSQAATGAPPGASTGAVAAKSVDKVSINYDTASTIDLEAGHWGLTIYGNRFIRLARMIGSGGFQL